MDQTGTPTRDDFLKRVVEARSLVEEATALSKALGIDFRFELLTLAPILSEGVTEAAPSVCFRVLKAGKPAVEIALWGFSLFQSRLQLMRQAGQTYGAYGAYGLHTAGTAGIADKANLSGIASLAGKVNHRHTLPQPCLAKLYQLQQAPVSVLAQPTVHFNQHPTGVAFCQSPSRSVSPLAVMPRSVSPLSVMPQRAVTPLRFAGPQLQPGSYGHAFSQPCLANVVKLRDRTPQTDLGARPDHHEPEREVIESCTL